MGTLCFFLSQWSRQDEEEETEGAELGGDLGGCADSELLWKSTKGKWNVKPPHCACEEPVLKQVLLTLADAESTLNSRPVQDSTLFYLIPQRNTGCAVLSGHGPWTRMWPAFLWAREPSEQFWHIYCKLRQRPAPTQGWPDPWFTRDRHKVPSSFGCQWHGDGWLTQKLFLRFKQLKDEQRDTQAPAQVLLQRSTLCWGKANADSFLSPPAWKWIRSAAPHGLNQTTRVNYKNARPQASSLPFLSECIIYERVDGRVSANGSKVRTMKRHRTGMCVWGSYHQIRVS